RARRGGAPAADVAAARVRRVLRGGGPVPADLAKQAKDRGVGLVRTYGLTETFGGMAHDGHPLDGAEVRIGGSSLPGMREKGAGGGRGFRVPATAAPMLLRLYRGEPGRTAVALRGGWLHTGDLGRIHHDGRLVVLGRVDDLVI